jgi:hypothetical protein
MAAVSVVRREGEGGRGGGVNTGLVAFETTDGNWFEVHPKEEPE